MFAVNASFLTLIEEYEKFKEAKILNVTDELSFNVLSLFNAQSQFKVMLNFAALVCFSSPDFYFPKFLDNFIKKSSGIEFKKMHIFILLGTLEIGPLQC